MDARINTHRDAQQDREQGGGERQFHRGWETISNQRRDRLFDLVGDAEIEAGSFGNEAAELQRNGIIKPEI
jgi:hypothetical protein